MDDFTKKLKELQNNFTMYRKTEIIPTNLLVFDIILGGGLPRGKMIELLSESGLGKSTLMLNVCKNLCEQGHKVVYLDFEGSVSDSQLDGMGVKPYVFSEDNPDGTFFLFQVSTYGDAEEILDSLCPTGKIVLVVIDSVAAMTPDFYLENLDKKSKKVSVTDARPGADSQKLSVFLKKYTAFKTKFQCSFLFINQLRTKISFLGPATQVGSGGNSLPYYMDIRIKMSNKKTLKQSGIDTINGSEEVPIGKEVYVEAYKNRVTTPFIKVPMTVIFGKGISNIATYIEWMFNKKVLYDGKETYMLVMKGAGFYTLTLNGKQYSARGMPALQNLIRDNYEDIQNSFTVEDFKLIKTIDSAEDISDITGEDDESID